MLLRELRAAPISRDTTGSLNPLNSGVARIIFDGIEEHLENGSRFSVPPTLSRQVSANTREMPESLRTGESEITGAGNYDANIRYAKLR